MTLQEIVAEKQRAYDTLYAQTKIALDELGVAKMNLGEYLTRPRIKLALINDGGVPDDVMAVYKTVLEVQIAELKTKWPLPEVDVITTAEPGAWTAIISTKGRKLGADGYHNVTRAGIPFALIVPGSGINPYGTYRLGRLAYKSGSVLFPARAEYKRSGVLTVLVHEVIEMLVDPFLKTRTEQADPQGRRWLIEVCSTSVMGGYYMKKIAGQLCILPNFSYPSAYDSQGVAPFDYMGVLKKPWTVTARSYPYQLTDEGKLVKITDAEIA